MTKRLTVDTEQRRYFATSPEVNSPSLAMVSALDGHSSVEREEVVVRLLDCEFDVVLDPTSREKL